MTDSRSGRCLCGEVNYNFTGEPNWAIYCHCESCRRATSSPVAVWLSVPTDALRFDTGAPRYYASSPGVRRGFCGTCGSQMTYENDSLKGEVHLLVASLTDPNAIVPNRHVFVDEQLAWFETADDYPRFAQTSYGGTMPVRHGPKE